MGIECERKFLVTGEDWRFSHGEDIQQGYLSLDPERIVRVRVTDQQAFLTVKGMGKGISREEFEYEIPRNDGEALLSLCGTARLEKRRHRVSHENHTWEVDEFFGENTGLVLAEIELEKETDSFAKPAWVGPEVTGDERYSNANLSRYPYRSWPSTP